VIRHMVRLMMMMARPPVVAVLIAFAAVGLAAAGHGNDAPTLIVVSVVVVAYFVNATALNDLSDEEVDRVNLQGARGRPLVSGHADRRTLLALAVTAAGVALAVGALIDRRALAVVGAGAVFNVAYSIPPARLSARGILAPLLLPIGFVAVPFLVAVFATGATPDAGNVWLLGALWVGFTGRIVLKDFRDVHGDSLYGKQTFLLRHGRRATCSFSAACWAASAVALLGVTRTTLASLSVLVFLGCALRALRLLSRETEFIAEQVEISAIAVAGRGIVVSVLAVLVLDAEGWAWPASTAVIASLTLVFLGMYTATVSRRSSPVLAPTC
jgi:4-hydroxybenzoate polyprenyltransferase